MTKESSISLIAAITLACVGAVSIAGVVDGRIAFDNQPDAMVTQLYASDSAAIGRSADLIASNTPQAGYHVPH